MFTLITGVAPLVRRTAFGLSTLLPVATGLVLEQQAPEQKPQLAAPESVAVERRGNCQDLVVTWAEVDGAERYLIYRSEEGDLPDEPLREVETCCNTVDAPPERGVEYTYWVRAAADDAATSEPSESASGSVEPALVSAAPLEITQPSPGRPFELTWAAVEGATGYVVERDFRETFEHPTEVCETEAAECSDNPETPQRWHYRVRAVNKCGESGPWATASAEFRTRP